MKILNLFLFFIQIALCYGVIVQLLPDPPLLPELAFYIPAIPEWTNNVMQQLIQLQLFYQSPQSFGIKTDQQIVNNISLNNPNETIITQNNKLLEGLVMLKEKLTIIENKFNLHGPETSQIFGGYDLETLRNLNIRMQNIIITQMLKISQYVNDILNQQNQEGQGQGGRGGRGREGRGRGGRGGRGRGSGRGRGQGGRGI
ncbi:hypothetical protein Mgra_00000616 [Meloidogyne graminicola]|uniref:Uncharacterized protein n=1 Tax=Meloidogyne graminicola TaxID=189291 RepID=A0A8T0A3Q4_9BILA|nr:hypothetical protein Mgra_00000616 [Meloidogyne graminicola]